MIGRISGSLIEKYAPGILVDVNGVGYELQVPMTTFYALPELEKAVVLQVHHSVTENSQQLFGFINKTDRELFRLLIKVNGVGPKMAIGIMSMESSELIAHIRDNNITALTKVPGVGKKTAERLVIEMRDKIDKWSPAESVNSGSDIISAKADSENDIIADAESALIALGYKPAEAAKAIAKVNRSDGVLRSEELIRLALKSMLPG